MVPVQKGHVRSHDTSEKFVLMGHLQKKTIGKIVKDTETNQIIQAEGIANDRKLGRFLAPSLENPVHVFSHDDVYLI